MTSIPSNIMMHVQFKEPIRNGEKQVTVRRGLRPYRLGDILVDYTDGDSDMVTVTKLEVITGEDLEREYFYVMQQFYPDLQVSETLTRVTFKVQP
jgi:hypothetical protein